MVAVDVLVWFYNVWSMYTIAAPFDGAIVGDIKEALTGPLGLKRRAFHLEALTGVHGWVFSPSDTVVNDLPVNNTGRVLLRVQTRR